MNTIRNFFAAVLVIGSTLLSLPVIAAEADSYIDGEHFRLYYKSTVNPLPLYRIHGWIIHIDTLDGKPVNGARVIVYGGMPAHRHGLPTRPRVTEELGDGYYRLDGVRFHMGGSWEMVFTIRTDGAEDTVVLLLTL